MVKQKSESTRPMDGHFESAVCALSSGVFLSLGSPVALEAMRLLYSGQHKALVDLEIDPASYSDASTFNDDYLAVSLLSKCPSLDIAVDRERVALEKFFEAESVCADTNKRLASRNVQGLYSAYTPESVMFTAREKIRKLLGPLNWADVSDHFAFGPGATYSRRRRHGDAYFKFGSKPEVTPGCALIAYAALRDVPRWYSHVVSLTGETEEALDSLSIPERVLKLFSVVPGNRVCTVPKNAKTDRTIAIEPLMNGYVQAGIGGVIRSRLKRVGVDLDDQSTNQRLARWGSVGGGLATIDLSSASDTVAMRLVEELLPPDWVDALKRCRSPVGVLPDGTVIRYQKVSSMGNGFTFELESLIFWALGSAVNSLLRPLVRPCWVYGDDIIISTSTAHSLIFVLNYCGFSCNMKKTFDKGVFRESCGKHYFSGVDVTPFYIREDITTPDRVLWFCNQVRRWSRLSWGLDGRMRPAYDFGRQLLPPALRKPSIPDGYGDFALFGDLDEVRPARAPHGVCGWKARSWCPVQRTREYGDVPYLLRQLSKLGQGEPPLQRFLTDFGRSGKRERLLSLGSGVPLPSRRKEWRAVKLVVGQWESFGPWWDE